jgi:hypothetical protein
MLQFRKAGIVVFTLIGIITTLQADVFIKQKQHTDAYTIMNQSVPAMDRVVSIWYSKDNVRIDQTADTTIIFSLGTKTMTMVYHKSKTYETMPVKDMSSIMADAMGQDDEMDEEAKAQAAAMMQQMAGMLKPTMTVKATGETKKIKTWNTRKYILTTSIAGTTFNSDIWACPDLKVDYKLYNEVMNVYLAKMPGVESMMNEIEKIKGIPVLVTSSNKIMDATVKTVHELVEIKENAAPPAGGYQAPAGYKKIGK